MAMTGCRFQQRGEVTTQLKPAELNHRYLSGCEVCYGGFPSVIAFRFYQGFALGTGEETPTPLSWLVAGLDEPTLLTILRFGTCFFLFIDVWLLSRRGFTIPLSIFVFAV